MSKVKNEIVESRIDIISGNLKDLGGLKKIPKEEFLSNSLYLAASKNLLQTSIEAMIDIGNHIIARLGQGIPENNVHTFEILTKNRRKTGSYTRKISLCIRKR